MENNIQTDTKESKIEKAILIVFLNLFLLFVSTSITIEILNATHQVILLQEEIILGMIIVPVLSSFVGLVVALLAWATRVSKKLLYVVPVVPLSLVVGFMLVIFGPNWINSHLTHDQIYGSSPESSNSYSSLPYDEQKDAAGLNEGELMKAFPSWQGVVLDDASLIANRPNWYWAHVSRVNQELEEDIVSYDQQKGHLSAIKSVDELWTDVQKHQGVKLGKYASYHVQWNLHDGEVVLVPEKDPTTEYHVYLKTDGEQVTIDHIVVKKQ